MNEKSNKYAMKALKDKRASIASDIIQLERQLRARKDALVHVDATIRLLDPSVDVGAIRNKRHVKHVKLFRQGELGRTIVDTLRRAEVPITIHDLVTGVMDAGGHEEGARRTMMQRVRGNLTYLKKVGKVVRVGVNHGAKWMLAA